MEELKEEHMKEKIQRRWIKENIPSMNAGAYLQSNKKTKGTWY